MKVEIKIVCDNAAFEEEPAREVSRILKELANGIERHGLLCTGTHLLDYNGNKVGTFGFWEDES